MLELNKALFEVQKELEPVVKSKNNPFFKSKYADLEAVYEATVPLLNKHGLLAQQSTFIATTSTGEIRNILRTELIHVQSGQFKLSEIEIIAKDSMDPQKVIAGMTYMRRASLTTICGLVTMDDDGNTASQPSKPKEHLQLSPLREIATGKKDDASGAKCTVKIIGVTKDTKSGMFKVKTANGEMITDKEVVAVLARNNIGKSPVVQYTVDENMDTILMDVLQ